MRQGRPLLNSVAMGVLRELPHSLDRSALVFRNSEGGQWDRLRKHWEYAVFAAGLEDFRFHDPARRRRPLALR